ncbi:MAG: FAD-binding protein [Syntrophomonadaceae bacterium]|nr:FAD-binding protein [Syntrophomonadaceae bacterium]
MNALAKDISRLLPRNQVFYQPEELMTYRSDATHYLASRIPDLLVFPETTQDISVLLQYAFAREIPVVPRGAGSGLAGGSTPVKGGIVVDMKRMEKIIEIDKDNLTAKVESGVVLAQFQETVEKMGLFYPPDPQSMSVCTLGGNVATRAGGPRGVKYGTTGNYLLGLETVLPDGTVIKTGGKVMKQSAGYDITHLMCGSEGTLGIISQITLRLLTLPPATRTLIVGCKTLDEGAKIVSEIIARGNLPAKLELVMAGAVKAMNMYINPHLPVDVAAYLFIELDGIEAQVTMEAKSIYDLCKEMETAEIRVITDKKEESVYWTARKNLYPLGYLKNKRIIVEDVTVPRNRIPELVREIQSISKSLDIELGCSGHAGDGNLHPTIRMQQLSEELDQKAYEAIKQIVKKGLEMEGTISGEHGIGIHKSEFLSWDLGEEQVELMKRIKYAFDPKGIMNPGKIWI